MSSFSLSSLFHIVLVLSAFHVSEGFCWKSTSTVSHSYRSIKIRCSTSPDSNPEIVSFRSQAHRTLNSNILHYGSLAAALSLLPLKVLAEETKVLSRSDVGFIDLKSNEPPITNVCWLDIQIGQSPIQRVEISLYGTITPLTAANFKSLCLNENGVGYKGSEIFRIISEFSVQGGSIGNTPDTPPSKRGRAGRSATGVAFPPENYKILHSYENGGVISMMKELTNAGKQDSRFFITLKTDASWGDDRYSAFGRVTKGMDVIRSLVILPVEPPSNYPKTVVSIVDSGCY
jgi:cyclophilin family peptidyl-prolyl cis-trans isomerase